jgi:hypothetical protein
MQSREHLPSARALAPGSERNSALGFRTLGDAKDQREPMVELGAAHKTA